MPQLEPFPYAYNSLEPFIDEATIRVHHDKHHQTYCDKFSAAIKGTNLEKFSGEEILKSLGQVPSEIKTAVINHGGGFVNHNFFWQILKKGTSFNGDIAKEIEAKFESYDKFKAAWTQSATTLFGSGWTWLVYEPNRKEISILNTNNQDSPLSRGLIPLLCIDVWEHAYYLKYQNKRAEYIENFFNVINWDKVNRLFLAAKGGTNVKSKK